MHQLPTKIAIMEDGFMGNTLSFPSKAIWDAWSNEKLSVPPRIRHCKFTWLRQNKVDVKHEQTTMAVAAHQRQAFVGDPNKSKFS
jgi:hypothetical protein